MTGISQLKTQWEREAREDERKLIADWLKNEILWADDPSDLTRQLIAIRDGSYRDKT